MTDPRLLLLDMTPLAGSAATSALKLAYFGDWRSGALLQLSDCGGGYVGIAAGAGPTAPLKDKGAIGELVGYFRPEVMLYRPVADSLAFHESAMAAIEAGERLGAGLVLWLMDDWPVRLQADDPALFARMDADLRFLIRKSDKRFAISESMAAAFQRRYGAPFAIAHNGVDPAEWPAVERRSRDVKLIRYAGSLAPETTRDAVFDTARVVDRMARAGVPVKLEGRTHRHWMPSEGQALNALKGVSFAESNLDAAAYRRWLSEADILLLAYNFDDATRAYLQYSFANKTPELMAAGAAILAYGPPEIETLAYLKRSGAALCVSDPGALENALRTLIKDDALRSDLGAAARRRAFSAFDIKASRRIFRKALADAAAPGPAPDTQAAAGEKAQFDECGFVYEALGARSTPGVMLDVGAHVGGSLLPFARAGWRVHAFEPDARNRAKLLTSVAGMDRVRVNPQAVGAQPAADAPFYKSALSSGISGLSAFHASHRRAGSVEVTTLAAYMAAAEIGKVDFLKIDVEGHEMAVLDGFDLDAVRPRAVVAEFEDAKTGAHGYLMKDLAGRFLRAGYTVLISEWWPVEQYGAVHSWRRLARYPGEAAPGAWGNLIALAEPLPEGAMAHAFAAALSGERFGAGAAAVTAQYGSPQSRSLYRRGADWLYRKAPGAARLIGTPVRKLRRFFSDLGFTRRSGQNRR